MKKYYFVIYATFCINPLFATVYSGTYTSDQTITNDSIIDNDSVFNGANAYVKKDKTLTVNDNVQFINAGIGPSPVVFTYGYKLNLNGDNIVFRDGNIAIQAGLPDWTYPSNNTVGNFNIKINGENILFDNNGFINQTTGGAIYIGIPNSIYYRDYTYYKQYLTVNGTGTVFSNNKATDGGAIYGDNAQIKFNTAVDFNDNSARFGGGAIYNDSFSYDSRYILGSLTIAPFSSFTNNNVISGSGGAIYNNKSYTFIGHDTLFSGNTASANGGAIYSVGKQAVVDIDTGNTSVNFATASDSIYNNGGTINFLGTGNINASLTSLTSVQGSCVSCSPIINLGKTSSDFDTVNISDNTIIKTMVYSDGENVRVGNISANNFNIQNDDRIKLVVLVDNRKVVPMGGSEISIFIDKSGLQSDGWDYFGNDTKNPTFNLEDNRAYNIEFVRDGVYRITPKNFMEYDPSDESDVADNVSFVWGGGTGFESGSLAENISNQIYVLSQSESTKDQYNLALDSVLPNTSGIIESFVNHSANANMRRIQQRQIVNKTGFWGNADYSALNYTNNKNDYTGSGIGGIFGQDVSLTNNIFIGGAIGYNQANMKNDLREIDISQQFNMSLYSKYTVPFNRFWFYADAILNHGQYSIKETRNIFDNKAESEISANSVSFQLDAGIKRNWFGVDGGFRYNMLSFGNFTDSVGQHVSGVDLNLAYATTKAYIYDNVGILSFGAHAGANFLLSGDKNYQNIAVAPNMQRYYYTIELNPGTMFSFGCNADVAITDKLTVGLLYDGIIDGNYTEHTGRLHFNYKL